MRTFSIELLKATAEMRPVGYLSDVLDAGELSGDNLTLTESAFQALRQKYQAPASPADWPFWATSIARIKSPADTGVGDTIARVVGPVGGEAYKAWFKRLFGKSCGCQERQDELNRRFPYVV